MLQMHTSQLKVATVLPELAVGEIQQITAELQEVILVNLLQNRVVRGKIGRQIRYRDQSGRLRKRDDELQFEVVVAENRVESAVFLKAALQPDYFVFHKAAFPDGQPILEQAFRLTFEWQEEVKPQPPAIYQRLYLNQIVDRGNFSQFVQFAIELPHGSYPLECHAALMLDPLTGKSLVTGLLKGAMIYEDGIRQERSFNEPMSVMIPELPQMPGVQLMVNPTVGERVWRREMAHKDKWVVTAKLDFSWLQTCRQDLECLLPCATTLEPPVSLRYNRVLRRQALSFEQIYPLTDLMESPNEVRVVIKNHQEIKSKRGIVLIARVVLEVFYQDNAGCEVYRELEYAFDALVTEELPDYLGKPWKIQTIVSGDVSGVWDKDGQLQVGVKLGYDLQFTVEERAVVAIEADSGGCAVLVEALQGSQRFTAQGEARLRLRSSAQQVKRIESEIAQLTVTPHTGWLEARGQLALSVEYGDRYGQQRIDLFTHDFHEQWLWDGVELSVELAAQARVIFDSFEVVDRQLVYRYLAEVQAEIFRKQELRIAVRPNKRGMQSNDSEGGRVEPLRSEVSRLVIDRQLPLRLGVAQAIASNLVRLDHFRCREAGDAWLVEGQLGIELEYWDHAGFLRHELLKLPFWNFVPQNKAGVGAGQRSIPRIGRCEWQPVSQRSKRKGWVKIKVEIELWDDEGGEAVNCESPDAKPD